tara:strand:+ start:2712 stop:3035 length:324 start_codon:yes stop_codon:yes gene_type:complete
MEINIMDDDFEKRIKKIRDKLDFNIQERKKLSKEISLDALKEKAEEIKKHYNKSIDNNELNNLKSKLKPKMVDSNMFGSVPTNDKPKKKVSWPKAIRAKHQDNRMIK